jgi:hypothetical protein
VYPLLYGLEVGLSTSGVSPLSGIGISVTQFC